MKHSEQQPARRRKWLWIAAGILLILLALLYGLSGLGMVNSLINHRVEKNETTPEALGVAAQTVALTSSDGVALKGWYLPVDVPKAVIVLVHGMDGIDASSLLPQAAYLQQQGYAVFDLDMRAHGRSGGDHIGLAFEEPRDIRAALDWIGRQPELQTTPVVLMGYSMGGASVIRAVGEQRAAAEQRAAGEGPAVAAVISVSAYSSIDRMINQGMKVMGAPDAFITFFGPAARLGMALRFGVWPGAASPEAEIGRIPPTPILIIHGSADSQVTVDNAYRLQQAAGGQATLWIAEGADHLVITGDGTGPENAEFWAHVLAFLAQVKPIG